MRAQKNLETVQAIYQAFGAGDIPALVERLTPDVEWTWHGPASVPFAGTFRGRDGVVEFLGRVGAHVEIRAFEPHTMLPGEDHVLVLGREVEGPRGSDRTYDLPFAHVYRLRDGRVHRVDIFLDAAAVAAAFA